VSEQLHPLYVDGPLAGQDFPVDSATLAGGVYAIEWPKGGSPSLARQDARNVHYHFRQYGISGHVIWVGTLVAPPQDPDWDDMAEHLLSEGAKRAAVRVQPPATYMPTARS
jgi:hypothetical protein